MKSCRLFIIVSLITASACKQNSPTDNNPVLDSTEAFSAETQISTETSYTVYLAEPKDIMKGLFFMNVTKQERHDGKTSYKVSTDFIKIYSNNYLHLIINIEEEEVAVILKYIDECQSFNPETKIGAQSLHYKGLSNYSFVFANSQLGLNVKDANENLYSWNMSLSEIRNLFAGAKERIETLKKEELKKNK